MDEIQLFIFGMLFMTMAIMLKQLCESKKHILIKPAGTRGIQSVGELATWLNHKVVGPIVDKIPEWKHNTNLTHNPILASGETFHKKSGELTIFIGAFPDKIRPHILGGVRYFLDNRNIKHKDWKFIDKDYQDDKKVVTLFVTIADEAPSITLISAYLQEITLLLELEDECYSEYDNSLNIPTGHLYNKIKSYFELAGAGLAPPPKNEYMRLCIYELRNMCKWAIQHGVDHIESC
jgi:hypothetical protein